MSTIGTEICGSSSRGSVTSATRPSASEASRSSGVSGELMNAARQPSGDAELHGDDDAGRRPQAGQHLDPRLAVRLEGAGTEDHGDLRVAGSPARRT